MNELRKLHCTHVYKFTCDISMEQKFCNVIMTEKKNCKESFTHTKENIITKEWLFDTAVGLHGCQGWNDTVMDPKKINQVFELPIDVVANSIILPDKWMVLHW